MKDKISVWILVLLVTRVECAEGAKYLERELASVHIYFCVCAFVCAHAYSFTLCVCVRARTR